MNTQRRVGLLYRILLCVLLAALLTALQRSHTDGTRHFLGFRQLNWVNESSCRRSSADLPFSANPASYLLLSESRAPQTVYCQTESFPPESQFLSLWIAGEGTFHITLVDERGKFLQEITRPEHRSNTQWTETVLTLPREHNGGAIIVRLSLLPSLQEDSWLAVRNRIDFFDSARQNQPSGQTTIWLLAALAVTLLLTQYKLFSNSSSYAYFFFLAAITAGIYLRQTPYFFWDEWSLLHRFVDLGPAGIIYTHNGHFLPLFFGIYYLEAFLFGDTYWNYLLISSLIHALNALLLSMLLERIAAPDPTGRSAARLLALCWMLIALHSHPLQWAFMQSSLLSVTTILFALLSAWSCLSTKSKFSFFWLALSTVAAPFLFGNGFSLALLLPIVVLLAYYRDTDSIQATLRNIALLAASVLLPLALCAFLYDAMQDGSESDSLQSSIIALMNNLSAFAKYFAVSIGQGTVLRGLGLYPSLSNESSAEVFQKLPAWLSKQHAISNNPELLFSSFGFAAALVLLLSGLLLPERRAHARLWLLGMLWIAASLLLPAMLRWQLGLPQALALRYHYLALCGLPLMLLTLTCSILRLSASGSCPAALGKSAATFVLFAWLVTQLKLGGEYRFFVEHGIRQREAVQKMDSWNVLRNDLAAHHWLTFEAKETAWQGMQPILAFQISPTRHPDFFAEVLHWLRPADHPLAPPESNDSLRKLPQEPSELYLR